MTFMRYGRISQFSSTSCISITLNQPDAETAVEAMNEYFFRYAGNYGRGAHRLAQQND